MTLECHAASVVVLAPGTHWPRTASVPLPNRSQGNLALGAGAAQRRSGHRRGASRVDGRIDDHFGDRRSNVFDETVCNRWRWIFCVSVFGMLVTNST